MSDESMPSLSEWLAEYRSRPEPREVELFRLALPEPLTSPVSRQSNVRQLRVIRYEEPRNPVPADGVYLLSEDVEGNWLSDTWHETAEDALAQAEYEFRVPPSAWESSAS